MNSLRIMPFTPSSHEIYLGALAACGYESRCTFAWQKHSPNARAKAALLFDKNQVLSFDDNRKAFEQSGFCFLSADLTGVDRWIDNLCAEQRQFESVRLWVDISSMTRLLIAGTCYALGKMCGSIQRDVHVDFVYANAEFGNVPSFSGPIVYNGPAIPALAGWPPRPSSPLAIILGVGYEQDLALGTIEELEAARVWAFRPRNHDQRYDVKIDDSNQGLFNEIPPANVVRYSLFDPFALFASIESLIALGKQSNRVLVVPFGPKIFALTGCLAALRHYPEVGVWRVSSGDYQDPVERKAAGTTLGLSAIWTHVPDTMG